MKKTWWIAGLVVVVASVAAVPWAIGKINDYRVFIPAYQRPSQVVRLDQHWTDEQRQAFHHTPQGTRLLPAAWFRALEQPCFSPFGCEMFADTAYLSRFGFIPSPADAANPDGLPIGFAIDRDFVDPVDKAAYPAVGLTCAACHTGELFYGRYGVQIEVAPAMIEVGAFQKALGLALAFTDTFPLSIGRYARFERRVLGPDASDEQKSQLKKQVDFFLEAARHQLDVTTVNHIYDNGAGFMRTDALARIGNQVFAADANIDANYFPANAPVRYPQIWNASWLNWVQYNSSISDPLARNIGEALGVRAVLKLSGPDAGKFENSVNMRGLHTIETLLAGPAPLQGLSSPKWPSVFPALDPQKVAAGAALYRTHCQGCHLPPLADLEKDLRNASYSDRLPQYWWRNANGQWFINVTDVSLEDIGTDPHQATDFRTRKANTGDLQKGVVSAAAGLDLVTTGIADRFFTEQNISAEERLRWSGGRDPRDARVRDELVYKARPLNGIWAVAPYLHNGSVPTLDALLSADEAARPKTFWMGSKEFDPVKVGYDGHKIEGGTLFDTTERGNSNAGHWFRDAPRGKGVIGPALSPAERAQLIEYLKSL